MVSLLSYLGRLGAAVSVALVALQALGLAPVYAEVPVRAPSLALAASAVGFVVLAALTGHERRARPWRPLALALGATLLSLAVVVVMRGRTGLPAEVSGPSGPVGWTAPGPIDLIGRDLEALPRERSVTVTWRGEMRLPASGPYVLSVEGRGRARVTIAGHVLLAAEGDPLRAHTVVALARGPVPLDVRLEHRGPGPRLRLGWTPPGGRSETVPPRVLGPARPAWVWVLTDVLAAGAACLLALLVWTLPWDVRRRPPAAGPVTATEIVLSIAGYVLLLVVMSWPLVLDLRHSGPFDRPDGRLNTWILGWVGDTVWTEPARLFDAPAFHPLPDALAFSENLLLPGALAAPLQWLGERVLAYNLVLLASLALSGLGAQLLVRRVSGDRLAAFVAGAYFAAGPHRWTRLSHLHAQMTVFLPFALLALDGFWGRRSLRRALAVGLAVALQGLASIYLGAITAAAVAIAVAVALFGGLRARDLARLAAGFLLAAVILWPVARPYLRMRSFEGQEFTLETVAVYAASAPSYLAAGTTFWGPLSQRLLFGADVRDTLFPGVVALTLGLVGLASAPRRYRSVAVVASVVAVVFSLGPETSLYRFLHEHVVLVRGVRALSRFALIPTLALSVLAGLALSGRRRLAIAGALVAMMVESANLPLRLGTYAGPSAAARWLAGREGAVLVLPLAEDDTLAMLDGLAHHRPLVNGDSGFIPRPFDRAMELFASGASPEGLRFLRAVGVRDVVAPEARGLPLLAEPGGARVYGVPDGPTATVVGPGRPAPTLWTEDGPIISLGETRTVGSVVFELSDAPWSEHPRIAVSRDGTHWESVEARASLSDATLSLYRDPRHGRGEVRFAPRPARFLRIGADVPARHAALEVAP